MAGTSGLHRPRCGRHCLLSHSDRHHQLTRLPLAVALAVTLVVAAGARPAPARAADTALNVTVNGVPVDVEAALASDPYDETTKGYTECFPSGASNTVILTGWSVATLISAAGTTPSNVTSVSVDRVGTGDGSVLLEPADFDPSATGYPTFSEGPALVMPRRDGGSLATRYTFFRPYRGASCAADPNGGDYVQTPLEGTLSIDLSAGTRLNVSSSQDRTQTSTTTPVTYSGNVANPPAGKTLIYRWTFSDGNVAIGQTVSHTYAAAGTYTATLSVSSGAAAGGQASPLSVTVGSAAGSSPAPGGGAGKTPGPTARSAVSPARRSSPTMPTRSATPTARRVATPASPLPAGVATPSVMVTPVLPTTASAAPAATRTASAAAPPTPTLTPPKPPVAVAAAGQPISGLLVAGLSRQVDTPAAIVVRPSLVPQLAKRSAGSTTSERGVTLGAAGTGLVTIVLLGIGAAVELRRCRR